ncbi:MAG: transposase [bacterium]
MQLAYNLTIFFKLSLLPRGVNRWTIDTIRRRLIAIPGSLVHKASGWVLSLPKRWPYKDIFRYAESRLLCLDPG